MQDLFMVLVFAWVYSAGLGLAKEQIPTLEHGGDCIEAWIYRDSGLWSHTTHVLLDLPLHVRK